MSSESLTCSQTAPSVAALPSGPYTAFTAEDLCHILSDLGVDISDTASNFVFVGTAEALGCDYSTGAIADFYIHNMTEWIAFIDKALSYTVGFPKQLLRLMDPVPQGAKEADEEHDKDVLRKFDRFQSVLQIVRDSIVPGVRMLPPIAFTSPRHMKEYLVTHGVITDDQMSEQQAVQAYLTLSRHLKSTWITQRLPMVIPNMDQDNLIFSNTRQTGDKVVTLDRVSYGLVEISPDLLPQVQETVSRGMKIVRSVMSVEGI